MNDLSTERLKALRDIQRVSDKMVTNETYIGAEFINETAHRALEASHE